MKRAISWTLIVLVILLGLVTAAVTWRDRSQRRELGETMARHAAKGYGESAEELYTALPPIDPDVRARLDAWVTDSNAMWEQNKVTLQTDWTWFLNGESLPPHRRAAMERYRPIVKRLRALLAHDSVRLSLRVWLPDQPGLRDRPYRSANWVVLCNCARWLALEALRGEDPHALRDLTRLARAMRPVGGLIESMALHLIEGERDRTMLALAFANRAPAAQIDAWLEEPGDQRQCVADALQSERLLWMLPQAIALATGAPRLNGSTKPTDAARDLVYVRWQAKRDMARALEARVMAEARLRAPAAPTPLPFVEQWEREGGWIVDRTGLSFSATVQTILDDRARHRLLRLAVRILRLVRGGAPLSRTTPALVRALGRHAAALDAGPWDVALRYRRLSPTRFRMDVDPESPVPSALDDEDRENLLRPINWRGKRGPLFLGSGKLLEVDVDAPR